MPRNEMPDKIREVLDKDQDRAQCARILRFLEEIGVDYRDVMAGRISVDLSLILGPNGKVVPEDQDYQMASWSPFSTN